MVPERDADLRATGELLIGVRRHFVIFNPASGRGRGKRRIAIYRRLLEDALEKVTFHATTRPGEERDLAERALAEGADVVVAVGGDGTWSNVADRLVASGRTDVVLGLLPNGTGNDFGRNTGYAPNDLEEAVRVLARGHVARVDVGRVDTPSASEHAPDVWETRHFLNVVGFGFDVAVIDTAARGRILKGEALYKVSALQQLFRFRGFGLGLSAVDGRTRDGRHLMLTISNGEFFGGGFPIAPGASVHDGALHACCIADAPPFTRFRLFNKAERGRHLTESQVDLLTSEAFTLDFDSPPRFEVDGDIRRAEGSRLEIRVLRDALGVVMRER